jgi:hypothetical protein
LSISEALCACRSAAKGWIDSGIEVGCDAWRSSAIRKAFFFEKKKQKTFIICKSLFASFSSEKEVLP